LIIGSLNSCPFGLPVSKGCRCAGGKVMDTEQSAISLMTPIDNVEDSDKDSVLEDNLEALQLVEEPKECPYLDSILKKDKVNCRFDPNDQDILKGQVSIGGSPAYPSIYVGNNSSMGLDPFGDRYLGNDQKTVYRGIYSLID
jgi:hypothetical protein